jgi:hypothetical protein
VPARSYSFSALSYYVPPYEAANRFLYSRAINDLFLVGLMLHGVSPLFSLPGMRLEPEMRMMRAK